MEVMDDEREEWFDQFNFFLIEYKHDLHAKLLLNEVERKINEIAINSVSYRIRGSNFGQKINQINAHLISIYTPEILSR